MGEGWEKGGGWKGSISKRGVWWGEIVVGVRCDGGLIDVCMYMSIVCVCMRVNVVEDRLGVGGGGINVGEVSIGVCNSEVGC